MANGENKPSWTGRIQQLVHDVGNEHRVIRPLLSLYGPQGNYVTWIDSNKAELDTTSNTIKVTDNPPMKPIILSGEFELSPQQRNDENKVALAAEHAAEKLALAEDAVVFYGREAATEFTQLGLNNWVKYNPKELQQQIGLFDKSSSDFVKLNSKSILNAIKEGIKKLKARGHSGEYCVLVSSDLYQEADTHTTTPADAPIHEIRKLLKKEGFRETPVANTKTGVIFSLGHNAVDIAVPVDATVEPSREQDGVAYYRLVEQLRLRVNDPTAVVVLKEK